LEDVITVTRSMVRPTAESWTSIEQ